MRRRRLLMALLLMDRAGTVPTPRHPAGTSSPAAGPSADDGDDHPLVRQRTSSTASPMAVTTLSTTVSTREESPPRTTTSTANLSPLRNG